MLKQLLAAMAALTLAAPLAAQAQEVPSYAAGQNDQQIQGRVSGFDGAYSLAVRDNSGYIDNVQLHDGTIINPTGLTLAPGMIVNIVGYNAGPVFDANEIDTPYAFENDVPFYLGHPWNYYGPTFGLSFFFGGDGGWWHHSWDRGGYDRGVAYNGGTSVNRVQINNYNNNNGNRGDRSAPIYRNAPIDRGPVINHFSSGSNHDNAPRFNGEPRFNSEPRFNNAPHVSSAPHFSNPPAAHFDRAPVSASHFSAPSSHDSGGSHDRRR